MSQQSTICRKCRAYVSHKPIHWSNGMASVACVWWALYATVPGATKPARKSCGVSCAPAPLVTKENPYGRVPCCCSTNALRILDRECLVHGSQKRGTCTQPAPMPRVCRYYQIMNPQITMGPGVTQYRTEIRQPEHLGPHLQPAAQWKQGPQHYGAHAQCVIHTPMCIVSPSHSSLQLCASEWSQSSVSREVAVLNRVSLPKVPPTPLLGSP